MNNGEKAGLGACDGGMGKLEVVAWKEESGPGIEAWKDGVGD